jgi:membrane glycosyltransferase
LSFLRKISGGLAFDTLARFTLSAALDSNARRYILENARQPTQSPFMVECSSRDEAIPAAAATALPGWRPALFFLCVGLTMAGLIWLAVVALSPGGLDAIDLLLVALFALTLPWYVIGFWNATIGLLIMRFARDPAIAVLPVAGRVPADAPITTSTAILVCIRNEPPERVARMLQPMLQGLTARGVGECFHVYVLSDTSDDDIAASEAVCFATVAAAWRGQIALTYRRRSHNIGFKAGNVGDFCARWGKHHDFAILLDADSVMTVDLVVKLVRIMQLNPSLGILQTLVIGMPSASPFARIFQFGMRLSMRSYTIGSAWWQGDCGPYWGHNAIVRLAPFMRHCQLPVLPGGPLVKGYVLSHDQIEAVLMRRAGYAVRVLASEGSSFEQNPPTLIEFIRRDLRWCQGNMQYWPFLRLPGLRPVSRYQLVFAILMFLGSPAWMGLLLIGSAAVALAPTPTAFMRSDAGTTGLILVLAMWFAPNIATVIDVLTRAKLRHLFGGAVRFSASFMITIGFAVLIAPIMWASHTLFLGRLLCRRTVEWGAQARHDHEVSWSAAFRQFWPQTLVGVAPVLLLAMAAPAALPYALLIAGGPLLSIPLAVATASSTVGKALIGLGLDRLPEEALPPPELRALKLPAIEMSQHAS